MTNAVPSAVTATEKSALRQSLRRCRRALSVNQQTQHAQQVAQHLMTCYPWREGLRVAITKSFDGELDLTASITLLQSHQVSLFLPVIQPDKTLLFSPYQPSDPVLINHLGIDEPANPLYTYPISQLDVLLMPLVGFDAQGNRLGMGGGYYDRTLATASERPYLIGVAHSCQQVAVLPTESWDIPLDLVVTELGVLAHCGNKNSATT